MALKIKEVCKAKGLKLSDLADKLGINPASLSASINGNPTIAWLQKVADVLDVEVNDLIERKSPTIIGCIMIGDEAHTIKRKEDIFELADKLQK